MIINTDSQLAKAIKQLEKEKLIAFDTETTGLNTRKDEIVGIGVYSPNIAFYVHKPEHYETLINTLRGKQLLAFNSYFDLEMVKNYIGTDLWDDLYCDVQMLKHTMDENPPFGLKQISASKFGIDSTIEAQEMKASIKANGGSPNEFYKADTEILGKYCIKDCELTYKLYELYLPHLEASGLSEFFFNVEVMPLYKEVTRYLQSRGVRVDVTKCQKLKKEIESEMTRLESDIKKIIEPQLTIFQNDIIENKIPVSNKGTFAQLTAQYAGFDLPKTKSGKLSITKKTLIPYKDHRLGKFLLGEAGLNNADQDAIRKLFFENDDDLNFNISSKTHLKKIFFDIMHEKPLSRTDKGAPQVNDEFIQAMSKKHQWCEMLRDYNKLSKLKNSYIDRFIELNEDEIFYPQFKQFATISGRYGSDLQQLPRPIEKSDDISPLVLGYRNQIRSLIVTRNNMTFVDADYESLEPHVFAHLSGEPALKAIFENGHDFYSTIAIMAEGLTEYSADKKAPNYLGKANPTLRQRAKAYALGIPYGMESFQLSRSLNIGQDQAQRIIDNYMAAFPKLHKWMKDSIAALVETGEVKAETGRVRRYKRQQAILRGFGTKILDSLYLWQEYNTNDKKYKEMKELRKLCKNATNNIVNFQVQSFAASVTNRACIEINRYMKNNNISGSVVAQIHDQIIVEVPNDKAKLMQNVVQDIMEQSCKELLTLKLKAPAELGHNFLEAH